MPNFRLVAPAIRWGTNLANAIYFPFPADSVFSGSEPRAGSEFAQAPSGIEAASRVGTDYVWAGMQRWIAQSDTLFYPRCTGWDGTLGVRVALESLQNRQTFSWHPDGRNLLRLPALNNAAYMANAGQGGWANTIDAGVTGGSVAFDGAEQAWKTVGTNPTGGALGVYIYQWFPSIPGEQVAAAVDYKASGLGGGAQGQLRVQAYTSALALISDIQNVINLTNAGSYARATTGGFAPVAPATTAFIRVMLELFLPAGGGTGTIWWKNSLVRRDSTDTTFIDNPSVDGCYLVDPTQFSPANETDGSRQLVMRIRNPSAPFDGY